MCNFLLSSFSYDNYTDGELLNIAEKTDNHLALYIYDAVKEEVDNNQHDYKVELLESVENTVLHLLSKPEWIKQGNQSQGVYWYLEGFNVDTSVHHHSVRIVSGKNKEYTVIIEHDEMGETTHEQVIEGLAKAKEYAKEWAIKYALRDELKAS